MNNDLLMSNLSAWADNNQTSPINFHCKYYKSCTASVGEALWEGHGCKMSYVGRQYGVLGNGEDFRLVLVGIDHGERDSATFEQRRTEVESYHQKGDTGFNPHYQGLVKTAAAILGRFGDYCQDNCKNSCNKPHDPSAPCVIDRIVQPNNVKCTPSDTINATSRATWIMKANCSHHLADELMLLQPNLVVFHGVGARQSVLPTLKERGFNMGAVDGVEPDSRGPVLYKCTALNAHVLFLYHPSRGWLDRQWGTVVEPALSYLRSRNLIPSKISAPLQDEGQGGQQIGAHNWSDALKQSTRSALENYDLTTARAGRLYLKHMTLGFGFIAADDLDNNILKVVQSETTTEVFFRDADGLIAGGWVVY